MTNKGKVFNDYTTDASNRNSFESSFYTMQKMHGHAQRRVWELEAALRSIAANTCCGKCQEAALVARAALGEKKDDAAT